MKKLTALATALTLSGMILLGVGLVKAYDQPASPLSQVTGDQGSSTEAESEVQAQPQLQEAQPQQDQTQDQDQPTSEQAPQAEQKE